jgi:hypothetical protein
VRAPRGLRQGAGRDAAASAGGPGLHGLGPHRGAPACEHAAIYAEGIDRYFGSHLGRSATRVRRVLERMASSAGE